MWCFRQCVQPCCYRCSPTGSGELYHTKYNPSYKIFWRLWKNQRILTSVSPASLNHHLLRAAGGGSFPDSHRTRIHPELLAICSQLKVSSQSNLVHSGQLVEREKPREHTKKSETLCKIEIPTQCDDLQKKKTIFLSESVFCCTFFCFLKAFLSCHMLTPVLSQVDMWLPDVGHLFICFSTL